MIFEFDEKTAHAIRLITGAVCPQPSPLELSPEAGKRRDRHEALYETLVALYIQGMRHGAREYEKHKRAEAAQDARV